MTIIREASLREAARGLGEAVDPEAAADRVISDTRNVLPAPQEAIGREAVIASATP